MSDGCLEACSGCAQDDFNSFLWNVVMLAMGGSVLGEAVKSSGLLLTITRARPVCMRLLRDSSEALCDVADQYCSVTRRRATAC